MVVELNTAKIKLVHYNCDVYEPSDDSFALVDALVASAPGLQDLRPLWAVEIGCGSGYVICSLALVLDQLGLGHCSLVATDVSAAALSATAGTLREHQLEHRVDLVQTDLLGGLKGLQGQVDLLVFNPPYVPTPDEELLRDGVARAWAGGHRGRRVIDRLMPQLEALLSPRGQLFMVAVQENDPDGLIQEMAGQGFTGSVVLTRVADEELLKIVWLRRQPPGNEGHQLHDAPRL